MSTMALPEAAGAGASAAAVGAAALAVELELVLASRWPVRAAEASAARCSASAACSAARASAARRAIVASSGVSSSAKLVFGGVAATSTSAMAASETSAGTDTVGETLRTARAWFDSVETSTCGSAEYSASASGAAIAELAAMLSASPEEAATMMLRRAAGPVMARLSVVSGVVGRHAARWRARVGLAVTGGTSPVAYEVSCRVRAGDCPVCSECKLHHKGPCGLNHVVPPSLPLDYWRTLGDRQGLACRPRACRLGATRREGHYPAIAAMSRSGYNVGQACPLRCPVGVELPPTRTRFVDRITLGRHGLTRRQKDGGKRRQAGRARIPSPRRER